MKFLIILLSPQTQDSRELGAWSREQRDWLWAAHGDRDVRRSDGKKLVVSVSWRQRRQTSDVRRQTSDRDLLLWRISLMTVFRGPWTVKGLKGLDGFERRSHFFASKD